MLCSANIEILVLDQHAASQFAESHQREAVPAEISSICASSSCASSSVSSQTSGCKAVHANSQKSLGGLGTSVKTGMTTTKQTLFLQLGCDTTTTSIACAADV